MRHLVALDWEYRLRSGEQPRAPDYIAMFPADRTVDRSHRPRKSPVQGPDGSLPHRLGKYRIVRKVGRGGMGAVYEAVHEPLDRRVRYEVTARH